MGIVVDDAALIKLYENRVQKHRNYQNRELWLNDDMEMLVAIKKYIDPITFNYLFDLVNEALKSKN